MYMKFMSNYTVGHSYLFGISKFYEFPPEETSEKPVYPCRYLYTLIYCKWKQICVIYYIYFDWL